MTPDQFLLEGKAWIEAASGVLDVLIVKLGILIIAAFGLVKTFKAQDRALHAEIETIKARQDRQSNRIDTVALAVTPPVGGNDKIQNNDESKKSTP